MSILNFLRGSKTASFTAQAIADHLKGEVEGNPDIIVSSPARIEYSKADSLCFLANPKYEKYLYTTKAAVVLINKDFELKAPVSCTLVRVDNAYEGIASVLELFEASKSSNRRGREPFSFISSKSKYGKNCYIGAFAYIDKGARLGKNVKVYPHVYIGENVTVGDHTVLFSGVKIYADCVIGAGCILHAGSVIGADGFGFAFGADGRYKKIPQTGNVIIEDNVEIGANSTVDRATMGSTIIHSGTKLDNMVQIAHNAEIGQDTVIAAQTGIAGSTKIGQRCRIAGQVGIIGHLEIGNEVNVGAKTGITNNVDDGKSMLGFPAMEASKYRRSFAVFRNLPELRNEVEALKKIVAKREENL
ncbi:MAG: UDP-3-O-(3-hydroxymyristoyl)glucosamine N-acyltransferase [Prevotellaceae bacterium]|nr:UDP-3-O-(3-hydroxymyristoyl)glucosamine N-acyltransferase [Prevotellaceae bacterium]